MKQKRILFLSPYPLDSAPSQRLKYEQYYPYIEQAGFQIETSSFISKPFWKIIYQKGNALSKAFYTIGGYACRIFDLFRLRNYDVVYVHLWVTPIGLPIMERMVAFLSRKLIYDIDDLVYLNDHRKHNKIMNLIRGRNKPIFLMKRANHVICCTPRLEEFVRKYNQQVTDISSTIDTNEYIPLYSSKRMDSLIIGWSGSHSTSRYLHLLDEVFIELAKKIDFTLKVIGDPEFNIPGVKVHAIPWSAVNEVKELQEFDIGVYPLPLDEEWVYGKSGLKALQYMALGIPTIATAIGANFRIIDDGVNGFLVHDQREWLERINQLLQDRSMYDAISYKAREAVVNNYSIKSTYPVYLSILDNEETTTLSKQMSNE